MTCKVNYRARNMCQPTTQITAVHREREDVVAGMIFDSRLLSSMAGVSASTRQDGGDCDVDEHNNVGGMNGNLSACCRTK